jgi:hypothetical protein
MLVIIINMIVSFFMGCIGLTFGIIDFHSDILLELCNNFNGISLSGWMLFFGIYSLIITSSLFMILRSNMQYKDIILGRIFAIQCILSVFAFAVAIPIFARNNFIHCFSTSLITMLGILIWLTTLSTIPLSLLSQLFITRRQ